VARLRPWYDVVELREDLRENRPLDASELAIHLDQVREGKAHEDYTDPKRSIWPPPRDAGRERARSRRHGRSRRGATAQEAHPGSGGRAGPGGIPRRVGRAPNRCANVSAPARRALGPYRFRAPAPRQRESAHSAAEASGW
jgi:hypothetical protein